MSSSKPKVATLRMLQEKKLISKAAQEAKELGIPIPKFVHEINAKHIGAGNLVGGSILGVFKKAYKWTKNKALPYIKKHKVFSHAINTARQMGISIPNTKAETYLKLKGYGKESNAPATSRIRKGDLIKTYRVGKRFNNEKPEGFPGFRAGEPWNDVAAQPRGRKSRVPPGIDSKYGGEDLPEGRPITQEELEEMSGFGRRKRSMHGGGRSGAIQPIGYTVSPVAAAAEKRNAKYEMMNGYRSRW